MNEQDNLDKTDRRILQLLQQDASLSATDIAEKVGLSQSPCWRRINRLQEQGYIKSKVALLDRHKLNFGVVAPSDFSVILAPVKSLATPVARVDL